MKRKLIRIASLALAFALLLALTACNTGQDGGGGAAVTSSEGGGGSGNVGGGIIDLSTVKNPNIDDGRNILGIAWSNLAAEATQVLIKNFEDNYQAYGFDELIVLQAENSLERQIDQIQDLVNQKCDMIIVNAVDPDGIVPVCESVMQQGIPVVAVDRRINTSIYYTLETDNTACGRDVARAAAMMTLEEGQAPGSVKVLQTIGNMTSSAVRDRIAGVDEEWSYWGHLDIIGRPSTESSIEKCYNAVLDAFKTHDDIKIIYVSGDNYVAPVVSALKELDRMYPPDDPRHVIVVSIDGTASALNAILAGESDICGNQRFDMFCFQTLEVCQDYMNGKYVSVMENNVKLPTPIVTRYNINHLQAEGILWALPPA